QVITGATFRLGIVGFERFAHSGKSIGDCVEFTATDGTNTETQTITASGVDSTFGDAVPVVEWFADMSSSTLDQGAEITCNYKAYPYIGDVPLDSSDGVNTYPSANYAPHKWLCNKTGAFGGSEAFVDS